MNIDCSAILRVARVLTPVAVLLCGAGTTRASEDLGELARLVEADGDEYIRLRDALLKAHPQQWDVGAAAAHSWETGIAAFILNERGQAGDTFVQWDAQRPRSYAHGASYQLSGGTPDAAAAFLLEKMWKGISEKERARGYGQYTRGRTEGFAHAGETALWKAIWEQCEDERYRYAVLRNICADPDPSVQPIIEEFLQREDDQLAGYRAKGRCLAGLWYRDTEQTVDAILNAWDVLTRRDRREGDAAGVLAVNSSERARRIVYKLVLDPGEDETLRAETAARCCLRRHPDDPDMFRKFFAGPGSIKMKTKVLNSIGGWNGCPRDSIRPVLRELITAAENERLTRAAAAALGSYLYSREVAEDHTVTEDIRLLEQTLERPNLSPSARFSISGMVSRIKEGRERFKDEAKGK